MLLTIGLPVTYNSIKELRKSLTQKEMSDNPYSNTTEEKTPSNNLTISEEYVHNHHHDLDMFPEQISTAYIHAHEAIYKAFHEELHYPPPNLIS